VETRLDLSPTFPATRAVVAMVAACCVEDWDAHQEGGEEDGGEKGR
jgi:hypothetical protein